MIIKSFLSFLYLNDKNIWDKVPVRLRELGGLIYRLEVDSQIH